MKWTEEELFVPFLRNHNFKDMPDEFPICEPGLYCYPNQDLWEKALECFPFIKGETYIRVYQGYPETAEDWEAEHLSMTLEEAEVWVREVWANET